MHGLRERVSYHDVIFGQKKITGIMNKVNLIQNVILFEQIVILLYNTECLFKQIQVY